ncbi:MAG: aldose 1-epimerase family protein [Chitinophagaceae bacterium]
MKNWKNKISNHAQLGGIETSVLDNGAGRGTRIAWINTGTGLHYKVVIDRGMDIADAFYNQYSIAWLSHSGVTAAQPFSDKGINWLRTFGGGLLTTCGLSHAGGPESDEYGDRGLHGNISNTAAEIESIIQPDPVAGKMEMSITGKMRETQVLGPNLELKRIISGRLGESKIYIKDEVTNKGNSPAPHMLLYHCNFGWPLVDKGTDILWDGKWKPRDGDINANRIFGKSNNFRKCPAPMDAHSGTGEEAAFIDIEADDNGQCNCGLYNSQLGIAVIIRFYKKQLPWLINWQHWGKNEYVTGLEPATNPPIGQAKVRKQNELILLAPGETKNYELEMEVSGNPEILKQLLKNTTIAV